MRKGRFPLARKPFELAVLFVRLYRSLDAVVGGDDAVARVWLTNDNIALDAKPIELIQTVAGLANVIQYLDARRALSSDARDLSGRCWRLVEAQHHVSTAKLTDTPQEQRRLEELLEESKPPVPPECRHLSYLLFTPFRYGAPYPRGSRFRRAGLPPAFFTLRSWQKLPSLKWRFTDCCFLPRFPPKRHGQPTQGSTPRLRWSTLRDAPLICDPPHLSAAKLRGCIQPTMTPAKPWRSVAANSA